MPILCRVHCGIASRPPRVAATSCPLWACRPRARCPRSRASEHAAFWVQTVGWGLVPAGRCGWDLLACAGWRARFFGLHGDRVRAAYPRLWLQTPCRLHIHHACAWASSQHAPTLARHQRRPFIGVHRPRSPPPSPPRVWTFGTGLRVHRQEAPSPMRGQSRRLHRPCAANRGGSDPRRTLSRVHRAISQSPIAPARSDNKSMSGNAGVACPYGTATDLCLRLFVRNASSSAPSPPRDRTSGPPPSHLRDRPRAIGPRVPQQRPTAVRPTAARAHATASRCPGRVPAQSDLASTAPPMVPILPGLRSHVLMAPPRTAAFAFPRR